MIFDAAAKTQYLAAHDAARALFDSFDASEDAAPLRERILELEAVVSSQIQQIADLREKILNAQEAILNAQAALA